MAAYAYSAINSVGVESLGEIHAPDPSSAREQLRVRGLLATRLDELPRPARSRRRTRVQEGQAEVAPDLLAPVRDDDRGGPERRRRARDPRAADRRQVPRRRHPRATRRRRGRPAALAGDGAPPEGLQPALRLDGRGGRGGRNPRHRARPRRVPDREGDADQAPRQGRDDLPDDGADLRDPRPGRDAALPRPGLREHLRAARRRPADAHPDRRACSNFLKATWFIIFPGSIAARLRLQPLQEDRDRAAALGSDQAPAADEDRRRRPQGDDGPLLAHALDARRRRRRHHQGARDHRPDRRQLGRRGRARRRARRGRARACRSRSR